MSTKIFNGFRYTPGDGQRPDPFTLVQSLQAAVEPKMLELRRRHLVELAVGLIDGTADTDEVPADPVGKVPAVEAEMVLTQASARIRRTGQRDPSRDFGCDITVLRDPFDDDALLFLVFSEQDLDAEVLSVPGVVEYRYWNNTDRPDHVDERAWAARARCWDEALGWDTPAERGLTWSLRDLSFECTLGDRDALGQFIPSAQDRARRLVGRRAMEAVPVGEGQRPAEWMRAARAARDAALGDVEHVAAVAASLAPVTVPDLFAPRH